MSRLYLIQSNKRHSHDDDNSSKSYRTFDSKSPAQQNLINEALTILDRLGIPIETKTARQLERMALAFLALCNVNETQSWSKAHSLKDNYALKTRDIIEYVNLHFNESLSRGSYDNIRRKDLKYLTLAEIAIPNLPNAARNDPNRAWAINPAYIASIQAYGKADWEETITTIMKERESLRDVLASKRELPRIEIKLPSGIVHQLGPGEHNQLQKAIIEQFLPLYGYGAEVIYIGDAQNKFLHYDRGLALRLGLVELAHDELPDIIAYSANRGWLYLIEAVHTSGPISAERKLALASLVSNCQASVIYVTAFLDRSTFRKYVAQVAWETEVWIAESPEHLIHFNGDKFLGPYSS